MNKSRFSYWKAAAVVAALAVILIPSVSPSTAESLPTPVATVGADLANEERVFGKYFDDLVNYDKQAAEFGKRARLVNADLEPLLRRSDDLKVRLSGVQSAAGEIIKKLKAANEWNDLDANIAARVTDAGQKAFFQETSFKEVLEECSSGLTSRKNEINLPLENLRKRLTSRYGDGDDFQIVRASYEAPSPAAFFSVRCSIGVARLKIIVKIGGTPTNKTLHDVHDACHAPGAFNPF